MKIFFRLQTGQITNEFSIDANRPTTFGRSSNCDFKVTDELISSQHFKLHFRPPKLEVIDLDSKNGTYLNGIRIDRSEMYIGDEVRAGSTKISITAEKMDSETVRMITFPGTEKDRIEAGLKIDFSGTYQQSLNRKKEASQNTQAPRPKSSVEREIEYRKQNTKILISKHEIKLRNRAQASAASTVDVILMIFAIGFPLFLTNLVLVFSPEVLKNNRLIVMLISEVFFVSVYYIMNFKVLKFTLGEKIAGIQALYENQN